MRAENEKWLGQLNELSVHADNAEQQNNFLDVNKTSRNSDVYKHHVELQRCERDYEKTIVMSKKVQLTYDQVQNWLLRIITKVDQQFNESIGQYVSKTMKFRFEKVREAINKQLE